MTRRTGLLLLLLVVVGLVAPDVPVTSAQRCPTGADLSTLLPLANCLVAVPGSLSPSQLPTYNGYACLQEADGTNGVPSECSKGGVVDLYGTCQSDTKTVVQQILNSTNNNACPQILVGPLTKYCDKPFGPSVIDFCTPQFVRSPSPFPRRPNESKETDARARASAKPPSPARARSACARASASSWASSSPPLP